jgi:hypothetical protein
MGRRLDHPTASFEQQPPLVTDPDVEILSPGLEVRFQRVGQIVDVDDDLRHAGGTEPVEHMIDQRLSRHLDQRFRPSRGERTHPLAQPGRHDHGRIGNHCLDCRAKRKCARLADHLPASCHAAARAACGTLAPNQARTGASDEWARSRSRRPHMRGWNAL